MDTDKKQYSCADCGAMKCDLTSGNYPPFCLTANMDETVLAEALALYEDPANQQVMRTAANVEHEGYLKWCRVQETIEFIKRLGFHKIGIASCVGLLSETRILAGILKSHGFEVYAVACKVGAVEKTALGIDEKCCEIGVNACNPILQAKLLNKAKTELNIVMGLCVGHDSLFYKYSEALTTTLVVKDRVTGHNPAAALYTANSYYKRLKTPPKD